MSRYSDYTLQALKYDPMAYWELNSSIKEFSKGEAFNYLTKVDCNASNRSLYYGVMDNGVKLDSHTSEIDIQMPPCCPIGKPGKEYRSWTINFIYQHLSDSFSSTTPIFKIGTNLELFFSGQKFYLNLRGKKFYVSVDNYKDLFHISIVNNKNGGNLIVNGYQSESYGQPSVAFDDNTSMIFSSDGQADYQISNLSMYNRELGLKEIYSLRDSNSYSNQYDDIVSTYDSHILGGSFFGSDTIATYTPDPNDVTLRNSFYSNNKFYLKSKKLARVIGGTFSSTGITFLGDEKIYVSLPEINFMDSRVDIYSDFSDEGTLVHFDMYQDLKVSVDSSGNLDVSVSSSSIYNDEISGDYISLGFDKGRVLIDSGSGYIDTLTVLDTGQSIDSLSIGNSIASDSPYLGKIESVSVNYYNYPIPVGTYKLDFNYDYGSAEFIKPQQAGIAMWSTALPAEFSTTSVDFVPNSSTSYVKTFRASDLVSDSSWFSGTAGTAIYPGTSAKSYSEGNNYSTLSFSYDSYSDLLSAYDTYSDLSSASESAPIEQNLDGSSVIVNFLVLLEDLENGSGDFVKKSPGIQNLSISAYSTNTLYSVNSTLELTSADQDAFIASDSYDKLSKRRFNGFKIYTDSDIVLSGIPAGVEQLSFRLSLDKTIISTGNDIEVVNIDDTYIISMDKNSETYTLSANSGTLYVDGESYSGGTLSIYNDYLITYRITSGNYTAITFSNLAGFIVNSLDLISEDVSSLSVSDLSNSLKFSPYSYVRDSQTTLDKKDFGATVTTFSSYSVVSG